MFDVKNMSKISEVAVMSALLITVETDDQTKSASCGEMIGTTVRPLRNVSITPSLQNSTKYSQPKYDKATVVTVYRPEIFRIVFFGVFLKGV